MKGGRIRERIKDIDCIEGGGREEGGEGKGWREVKREGEKEREGKSEIRKGRRKKEGGKEKKSNFHLQSTILLIIFIFPLISSHLLL